MLCTSKNVVSHCQGEVTCEMDYRMCTDDRCFGRFVPVPARRSPLHHQQHPSSVCSIIHFLQCFDGKRARVPWLSTYSCDRVWFGRVPYADPIPFLSPPLYLVSHSVLSLVPSITHLTMSLYPQLAPGQQKYRVEKDTFGDLNVPADRYYGAQTQR